MQKQSLAKLLNDLDRELLRLGYTNGSMQYYRREWKKLQRFIKDRGEIYYSEPLGLAFIREHYQIKEQDYNRGLLQSEVQKLRVIRMIGDFQLHHTILQEIL